MVFLKPLLSAVTLISPIVAAQVAAPVPVRQATPYQSGLQAGLLAGVRLPLQPGQTTNYQNFAPVGQAPTYQNPAQAPASSGGLLGLGSVLSSTPVVGPLLNSLPLVGPLLTGVNSGVASPQPQPQPVSQVQPAPRPVTQPVTQPQPVSQVQPAPRPATQPVPQPQPVSQVQPAPRPATQPVTQPQPVSQVQPAPRPATQPVPQPQPAPQVQPAPRPAPAASPAPASTPPVTAAQVVSAIQFFTTRSLYIYQTTQAITLTDVTSLLQGRGNIAQLVSSVSDLASSLPAATSIFSRAPRFTAPADVNSIYNAYAEFVNTQTYIVNSLGNKVSLLRTVSSVPSVLRQSLNFVTTIGNALITNIIPSRSADVQKTYSSFYVSFQASIYLYTGTRSKREISQPMRFMPREIAPSA